MKKTVACLMAFLLLLGLFGCAAQAAPGSSGSLTAEPSAAPETDAFPTLPEPAEDPVNAGEPVTLGFQWLDVYPGQSLPEADFGTMSGQEAYDWYRENGTFWYITNEAGELLEISPWGPEAGGKTTMELLESSTVDGINSWEFYTVPYSPAFTFASTRDDRPCCYSVSWKDRSVTVKGEHTGDLRISSSGVSMKGESAYAAVTEPMCYTLTLRLFDPARSLTVSGKDCSAFLLVRDGNGYTVTASHECEVTIKEQPDGAAERLLASETVPAGATWYVEDLSAPEAELKAGLRP